MKVIERGIFPFQEEDFFSPIRDKMDYARVVALSARKLLLPLDPDEAGVGCTMKLIVDKMSRLFYYKPGKYFSIAFPFYVGLNNGQLTELVTYSGKKLESINVSAMLAVLNNEHFRSNTSLIDLFIEPGSLDSSGLFLLEEVLQFEPGYIRYDVDPENVNGKYHPLNHFDINYSQYGTYKLGLNDPIQPDRFENLQNTRTECSFVVDL